MSRVVLLFIFSCLSCFLFSQQNYKWSDPVALSDSLSDHSDATLKFVNFYAGESHYVFWVRSENNYSSDIVAKRYYETEQPVPVVFEGDIKYRNPQVIPFNNFGNQDTLFALLYEAETGPGFDIFYQFYTTTGFTNPIALTNTFPSVQNMDVSNSGAIVWEQSDTICFTRLHGVGGGEVYFDTITRIDSIGCGQVTISKDMEGVNDSYVAYMKYIDDTARICLRSWESQTSGWSDVQIVSQELFNVWPKFSESSWSMVNPTLSWDKQRVDSSWIQAVDPYLPDEIYEPAFAQYPRFNTHFYNVFMGVDWIWDYAVMVFEWSGQEQTEIYGNEGWLLQNISEHVSISKSPSTPDINPYLFEGRNYSDNYQDVILIWEKWRHTKMQLFTSKIRVLITGGQRRQVGDHGRGLGRRLRDPGRPDLRLPLHLHAGQVRGHQGPRRRCVFQGADGLHPEGAGGGARRRPGPPGLSHCGGLPRAGCGGRRRRPRGRGRAAAAGPGPHLRRDAEEAS
jgi:hypothetical protein